MDSGDIEDGFVTAGGNKKLDGFVQTKLKVKKDKVNDVPQIESDLGWSRKVFVRTWGCAHNSSDSEYMSGLLVNSGFKLTSEADSADLWILNSCTVKTPSENQLENEIGKARKQNKKVVVAGCVSQAAPTSGFLKDVSIVGVQQVDQIVNVVEETLKGNVVRHLSLRRKEALSLDMPKVRRNKFVEILAINTGCLNHCTYCKTKQARGDLKSFHIEDIVRRAQTAFQEGCKEIWLTSEDLGAYGRDIDHVLPDLLNALVEVIPEDCMMRLGMTNPPYILDHLQEISEILNHPRVYSFLHIPVQAGSDAVLAEMKREYTSAQFCKVVEFMREKVPNVYIATDFICAFPSETSEDFEDSMRLVRKYKFPSLFINQFYPRPGTPAARLKKIDTIEARRRTAAMTELFKSYSTYNEDRIGNVYKVLVCERATDKVNYVGHNKAYEHILISSNKDLMGKWVVVKITEVSKFYMKGRVVDQQNITLSYKLVLVIPFLLLLIFYFIVKLL
ncbi:unnamed protein product [Bursaphelenchus okinawaensis]|uniref:tRNA-t(6)A37 methylthiotransferase n=1 Tax=Bursaphelenchus okinawaensis TaxID=465554 RepID=A0A811JTF3_9BILA|nr:unnamed protein product [Bursaphelenchus okinawaensis]CAG9082213.1 unnamed protein product [Bursaphelenchus okinawaensis]